MRPIVIAALVGLFLAVGWRHLLGLRKSPIVLTVLALAIGVLGLQEALCRRDQGTYAAVVEELSGRPGVKVHCQRTLSNAIDVSNIMGYVPYPIGGQPALDVYLRLETCRSLSDYLGDPSDPSAAEIQAVHVLTHEAMHVAGERVEHVAECSAMQRDYETARLLGATMQQAAELPRLYRATWYPRLSPSYTSPECAEGEPLDLALPYPPW